ncbi:TROVE domain-containing protein, partial [bacterium]
MKLASFNPFSKTPTNHAGGPTHLVDPFVHLDRFLMLGSEGGTYYVSAPKLTVDNAQNLLRCLKLDGPRTVRGIVEVSEAGRAPRQDPAVFALAVAACHGDEATRAEALAALPRVCRTATHLFQFLETANAGRGWGRALRRAVGDWYGTKDSKALETQMVKYRRRNDWTHRDALRLSHAKPPTPAHGELYAWSVGKGPAPAGGQAEAMARLTNETDGTKAAEIVRDFRLPREAVPTELLRDPFVWEALLTDMPMTAMIRNLVTMSRVGLLAEGTPEARLVAARLVDVDRLRRARVHPVALLMALRTYATGYDTRSGEAWYPAREIVTALNVAFHLSFGTLVPTGKRFVLGLDVSGSMDSPVAGSRMTCAEGAAAMAMAIVHAEEDVRVMGFADRFRPLPFEKGLRLDAALAITSGLTFGATDCGLPMRWARNLKLAIDT